MYPPDQAAGACSAMIAPLPVLSRVLTPGVLDPGLKRIIATSARNLGALASLCPCLCFCVFGTGGGVGWGGVILCAAGAWRHVTHRFRREGIVSTGVVTAGEGAGRKKASCELLHLALHGASLCTCRVHLRASRCVHIIMHASWYHMVDACRAVVTHISCGFQIVVVGFFASSPNCRSTTQVLWWLPGSSRPERLGLDAVDGEHDGTAGT